MKPRQDVIGRTAPSTRTVRATLVVAALTMSVVSTLGTSLIPTIARTQDVSIDTAQWILTATLLTGAVATPVIGRLGDGPRRTRVLALTLLCVCGGSIIGATSSDRFWQLIIGRGLQGIGYATVPLTIAVARDALGVPEARKTIAILSVTVAAGSGLGFPVTGVVADALDFHAAFWMAAVASIVSAASVWVVLRDLQTSDDARDGRFDALGAVLLGSGLLFGLLAISQGEQRGWGSFEILALTVLATALLAVWAVVELRTRDPLIDLRLMANRAILGANAAGLLIGFGLYMTMSLLNLLAQTPASAGYGFGASLTTTGLLLLPLSIASLVAAPLARMIGRRFGARVILPIGSLVTAGTAVLLAFEHEHLAWLAVAAGLAGVGVGCSFAAMPAIIVAVVPRDRTGSATSLNQVLRTVGGAIGSAATATILAAHVSAGDVRPTEHGFNVAFFTAAGVCVATSVIAFLLVPAGRIRPAGGAAEAEAEQLMTEQAASAIGPSVFDGERQRP